MRPYNKTHRLHRKLAHVMIGTQKTVEPYLNLQEKEAHRFLFRVLQQPEKLLDHIRTEAGAVILKIIYGYTVETHNLDPLVHLVDVTIENFGVSTLPGEWYVDIIPALKYVPGWMPGTRWKKTARKWRAILVETLEKPLEFARQQIAKGDKTKSFISEIHREYGDKLSPEYEHALKWVAFSMYAAGADTTVSTISSFYLAMTLFPEVQRRAREEIDRVIGTGRLPAFGDRESLPYVDAVVKEAWRWHPVTPMGIAHRTTADDMINGYYIPKGATILTNIWWFTHDPAVYPNPSAFDPSRYLGPNPQPDPANHIFGYGRRICPGRYLGTSSVWLTISRSLAVFDIRKSLDESGREVEPHVGFSPGLVSRIEPFQATIKPRSAKHEALIRQLEEIHPWEKSNADEIGENVSLRD
ncbi:putative cytochrome P450 oxidoreductase [Rosellinia necatrix]|uniref:Putative cytochrome P450 oxidoreductase n=1 Tax=Rosellinia necatrix TaxID=77044 RepID=A0A1W2TMK6_ROSNE|nr:putative cytochrome P450 oxidoreductase [Rosellinia necatrix]